jgi:Ni,Fe-hydrogenase III large subunit/Ni,Fe-hydrogenase III component G
MTTFNDLNEGGRRVAEHRSIPRVVVGLKGWELAAKRLHEGRLTLLGLWADKGAVHLALLDEPEGDVAILSYECPDGRYPSIAAHHPPAIRLERAIRDLFGHEAEGLPDARPWLDHGRWGTSTPLGDVPRPRREASVTYTFLRSDGENLHQIPVGPVHAGIIEPGHFRFTASGETVVRLEERLGYVHKGIEKLMEGADLARAIKLAGRTSGDSAAAYAIAFARASEAALGLEIPPRAHWLRALMGELERLANHFGDIGAVCNDASFAMMQAHCAILRERVLRAADAAFGHRLMRDCVLPGGVVRDLTSSGAAAIRALLDEARRRFPALVKLYDNTASLMDRTVGTGILRAALARQFGAGGFVGRASGRAFDARRKPGYPPYDQLSFEPALRSEGDVNARIWVRIAEVEQSLDLIGQILQRIPVGPVLAGLPEFAGAGPCEGLSLVEGFRGDILAWVRLGPDGRIDRCHLRDPSWFQWPLLEAVIEGNIVADFPLCNKSFNCSYSGHDL